MAAAEYADYLDNDPKALEIIFEGDTIGTSAKTGLKLTLPTVNYKTANVPVTDDFNLLTVEFEAVRDPMTAVLTNLLTAYN